MNDLKSALAPRRYEQVGEKAFMWTCRLAVMWRGTTWGKPIRTGASFVGLGTHRHRVVFYPISHPDPQSGL